MLCAVNPVGAWDDGKDLWNRYVLSLEYKKEGEMDGAVVVTDDDKVDVDCMKQEIPGGT